MKSALSLARQLVEQLGEAIVVGVFAHRPFPTEGELAHRYRAGRATVREAVKMLVAKGLLHGHAGQGTFVASETAWRLYDPDIQRWLLARRFSLPLLTQLTQVRLGAEPVAAALAARHMTDAVGRAFETALGDIKVAARGERDMLSAKVAFHLLVLDTTRNSLYRSLGALVTTGLTVSATFANRCRRPPDTTDYDVLCAALTGGEPERSRAAMRAVIGQVMRAIAAHQSEERLQKEAEQSRVVSTLSVISLGTPDFVGNQKAEPAGWSLD